MRLGDVYERAKAEAESRGESIASVVERLLAQYLDKTDSAVDGTVRARVGDFLRVRALPPHKLHADQFEEAEAVAAGAMIGARMAGKDIPPWTEDAVEAFRAAVAEAFDAGFRASQEAPR